MNKWKKAAERWKKAEALPKADDEALIRDLDAMIATAEKRANPDPLARQVAGCIHPMMKAAMPEMVKKAKADLLTLTRARDRILELTGKEDEEK